MLKKRLITAVFIGISTLAYAKKDVLYAPIPMKNFIPAVYMGLQGGYGATNWDNINDNVESIEQYGVSGSSSAAGRFYLGYDWRPHFSVEAGYTQFFNNTRIKNFSYDPRFSWVVDASLKIKFDVTDIFGIYGKIGFNYFNSSLGNAGSNSSIDAYNVLFGVGGVYNINDNLSLDLSWTRYGGISKWQDNYVPDADFFAVGLCYKFYLR